MTPAALVALLSDNLENFEAASTPGGIEAQERRGQLEEATKQTLPIVLNHRYGANQEEARKPWEALGFKFGKPVDNLFVECEFPKGWGKVPTDHAMHTDIVDDKGHKRGNIFYKAAFYDRNADARLTGRFRIQQDYDDKVTTETIRVIDELGKVEKAITGLEKMNYGVRNEKRDRAIWDAQEGARKDLEAWLN